MATKQDQVKQNCSILKAIRFELRLLLNESSFRGKIQVNHISGNQELIILVQIQEKGAIFPTRQEIEIKVSFLEDYPHFAPQVFLKTRLLSKIFYDTNILDPEKWKPQYNLVTILSRFIKEIQKGGLKIWLSSRFGEQQNTSFMHRHNKIGAYIKQNIQLAIPKFVSAFKPFRQTSTYSQQLASKLNSQASQQFENSLQKVNEQISNENKKTSSSKKLGKKLKKQTKPMNKNANLPKFLIRIFIKYLDKFKLLYTKKQYDKLMVECRKMKEGKKNDRRQQAFGLKHLIRFFNSDQEGFPSPDLNRKVVTGIISNYLLEQICQNSQIPQSHRVGYLVACKVYALRCRNPSLASRIQSK